MTGIGAAVVGTGFIGVVHVEALRGIGVDVVGVVGSSPERARQKPGLPEPYESFEAMLADERVQVVHLTTPNHLHYPQVKAVLAAGKHVVCEKPLALTSEESGELLRLAEDSGLVHCTNYNVRFYPILHEARERVRRGDIGRVWNAHGTYIQDWLHQPTDWNWRLDPELGGSLRAVADIGTHWMDLTGWITGRRVAAVFADLYTVHPVRHVPTGPVETYADAGAIERVDREMATEDIAHVLLRYEDGSRGQVDDLAGQRGPEELRHVRGRRLGRRARLELRAARRALARPSRPAERAALSRPVADERAGPRRLPGRPRRGIHGHLQVPLPRRLPSRRGGRDAGRARFPDLRGRARGDSALRCDRGVRRERHVDRGAALKLGLLTAAFPDLTLEQVAAWAAGEGFESLEIACWPAGGGERRRYAGVTHIDVDSFDPAAVRDVLDRHGLEISSLAYYPNNLHPDDEHRKEVNGHLLKVVDAAQKLGVEVVGTFVGNDKDRPLTENLERFGRIWPDLVRHAGERGVKIAIENCPMIFSEDEWPGGNNLAWSPAIWEQMFTTIPDENFGLNLDPSHLVWLMIDRERAVYDFADRIFHVHAKDMEVRRDGLYRHGTLSSGMGWQVPRLPGLGEVDWPRFVAALYAVGYDRWISVEHEDRRFEGDEDLVKRGFLLARNTLRPLIV